MTLVLASFLCRDEHTYEKQLIEKESTCLTIPSHRPQFWRIQGRDSHDLLGQEQKENTQILACAQLSPLFLC